MSGFFSLFRKEAAVALWLATTRRIRCRAIILTACACLLPVPLFAGESSPIAVENEIKAVYIVNFVRFTEWPAATAKQRTTLSILGNLPLLKILKGTSFKQTAASINLETHSCVMPACAQESHALFIDKSESRQLQKIFHLLQNRPTLTISDVPGFADMGGMIELKKQGERVIFRINLEAIEQAQLYVSAELLQLAEIVGKKP